jgi:beta-mannosidase
VKLNENWKRMDFAPGQGLPLGAHAPGYDDSDWLPADVPGDVHTSLVKAGRIQTPFYNMNIETCQWVEEREWWYRTTFHFGLRISTTTALIWAVQDIESASGA